MPAGNPFPSRLPDLSSRGSVLGAEAVYDYAPVQWGSAPGIVHIRGELTAARADVCCAVMATDSREQSTLAMHRGSPCPFPIHRDRPSIIHHDRHHRMLHKILHRTLHGTLPAILLHKILHSMLHTIILRNPSSRHSTASIGGFGEPAGSLSFVDKLPAVAISPLSLLVFSSSTCRSTRRAPRLPDAGLACLAASSRILALPAGGHVCCDCDCDCYSYRWLCLLLDCLLTD